jgi:DNA-3-methyladenine glycosylase I
MFEFVVLESAQSGLSWITILRKREGYRRAFSQFDPDIIARYAEQDIERLMSDASIVRNKRKIEATIQNARATLALRSSGRSLSELVWSSVGNTARVNQFSSMSEVPAKTAESEALALELKSLGFKHIGPIVAYSLMQAMGVVNDHLLSCHSHVQASAIEH